MASKKERDAREWIAEVARELTQKASDLAAAAPTEGTGALYRRLGSIREECVLVTESLRRLPTLSEEEFDAIDLYPFGPGLDVDQDPDVERALCLVERMQRAADRLTLTGDGDRRAIRDLTMFAHGLHDPRERSRDTALRNHFFRLAREHARFLQELDESMERGGGWSDGIDLRAMRQKQAEQVVDRFAAVAPEYEERLLAHIELVEQIIYARSRGGKPGWRHFGRLLCSAVGWPDDMEHVPDANPRNRPSKV